MKTILSYLVVFIGLTAGYAAFADQADANSIEIKNYIFAPATLTVKAGETVTWINHDQVPHTIVETNTLFRSAALDTDDKYTYKFEKAGTYKYFCSVHPQMTATVVVK
jgi:plastocyanin